MLPQPAPIVRAFHLNVNTIITAGDATAGVSLGLSVSIPCMSVCLSVCPCPSISLPPAFLPSVVFNCYHYVSAKWNPLGIHFVFSTICKRLYFSRLDILTVMGEREKALRCRLASLFPIVYSPSPDSVASD